MTFAFSIFGEELRCPAPKGRNLGKGSGIKIFIAEPEKIWDSQNGILSIQESGQYLVSVSFIDNSSLGHDGSGLGFLEISKVPANKVVFSMDTKINTNDPTPASSSAIISLAMGDRLSTRLFKESGDGFFEKIQLSVFKI